MGWYRSKSGNEPHLAKLLAPNGWGLYDMAGNAWEHINDVLYNDFVALGPSLDLEPKPLRARPARSRSRRSGQPKCEYERLPRWSYRGMTVV